MKRGLLKVAVLTMSLFGAVNMYADDWSADTPHDGVFLLYNVGSGQYFTKGNGWGTQASITSDGSEASALPVALLAVNGNFIISTGVNNWAYGLEALSGGTMYTDQGRNKKSTWEFNQVGSDSHGPIYNIISAENHGDGSGKVMSANAENTVVGPGSSSSDYAKWQLVPLNGVTKSDIMVNMSDASAENPVDVTGLIANAQFEYIAGARNWNPESIHYVWNDGVGNFNMCGGKADNHNAESWRAWITLTQTLTDLPKGTYVLKAQAAMTAYDGSGYDDMPVVYANDETSDFKVMANGEASMDAMSDSFTGGLYNVDEITVVTIDGTLKFGVRGVRNNTWCVWDNFRLYFKGFDINAVIAVYQQALSKANNTLAEAMNADVASELSSVISQYSSVDQTSEAALNAAIEALNAATEVAEASAAEYVKINDYLIKYSSEAWVADLVTDYNNRVFTTFEAFLPIAQAAIVATLGATDGVDITALIMNSCPTSNNKYWNGDTSNAFDPGNNVAEFWNMSGATMYQTLPQLPEGTYVLTVRAITRDNMSATISSSTGESEFIEGIPNTVANSRGQVKDYFAADPNNGLNVLKFNVVGYPKDVTITLTADNETPDHWLVWRDFTLTYNTLDPNGLTNFVFKEFGNPEFKLADGTVINNGDTKTANANQIKDGIVISFPNNEIYNVPIHPSHYQAKGKIENTTDGITYIIRSNGYFDNGYNPNFDIHFGWGLFGWSNTALEDYIAAVGYASNVEGKTRKAKTYRVTINELAFINTEMDAVDMNSKGYEANVIGMSHPGTYTPGTYTEPYNEDMTAEDYYFGQYIYDMFVEAFTAKHGRAPIVEYTDIDALLEMQRYYNGWTLHDGDGAMDGPKGDDAARPYRPLTDDEVEYIRFFLATFCDGVIIEKNTNVTVPYVFTIKTTADVQQDTEKITRDQVVTAWDVKGNQVTDLLFEQAVETRIEGIEAASSDAPIYNLAGQRVQTARQGIYVVGGKKVVLK